MEYQLKTGYLHIWQSKLSPSPYLDRFLISSALSNCDHAEIPEPYPVHHDVNNHRHISRATGQSAVMWPQVTGNNPHVTSTRYARGEWILIRRLHWTITSDTWLTRGTQRVWRRIRESSVCWHQCRWRVVQREKGKQIESGLLLSYNTADRKN